MTKNAGENGTIEGPDTVSENGTATFTITPNEGFLINDVRVNGTSVGAVTTYTVENVNADITIEVTYREKPFVYSVENPFTFPTEVNASATLEMEYLEQHNNTEGDNNWPLQITEASWANNGKFLNCLNGNDRVLLYYNAPCAGTYTAVVTYRSGDANNSLVWSEAEGKITEGNVSAGSSDSSVTKTATFTFEVTEAGAGVLTFKGGESKAPQLDKIEITATTLNEEQIEAELKGHTMSLEGNIGVNFHMLLGEEVTENAGAKMLFTLEREDGKEYVEIPVKDATIDDETGYYVFKCTVPVKDMDTEITAQIILSDERKGSEYTYKVKNYIEDILENPGDFAESEQEVEKLSALVETMSDFGDYASAYFADEATEGTPALPTLPELTTEDLTKLENNKGIITKDEDSIYYGSSLLLKSDTILRHYFKEKVEGSTQKGNLYYIDSTGIPAHKLGEMLVTKVGDMEITYNPLSYAYIALSREGIDEELKSVMHAMYLYYKAAQEYNNAN